jgi:hypothetical protein
MRRIGLHLIVACIAFAFSTHVTKVWNAWMRGRLSKTVVQGLPAKPNQLTSSDEPELLKIYQEYAAAQTRHDRAFFERVEADDFRLFANGTSYSRTEDIELMNAASPDLVYSIEDLRIESDGNSAVVRGRMSATGKRGNFYSWNWIDVSIRRAHGWQIISTTQAN